MPAAQMVQEDKLGQRLGSGIVNILTGFIHLVEVLSLSYAKEIYFYVAPGCAHLSLLLPPDNS